MIDRLKALCNAPDVLALRARTREAFAEIGFQAAYFISPLDASRGSARLMTNSGFPEDWESAYRNGAGKDDPVPGLALARAKPVIWNRLAEDLDLTGEERAYLDSLSQWGMQAGVGIVTYGPAARAGFAGVGLPRTPEIGENPDTNLLQIAAQTSFLRYCQLIEDEIEGMPGLSPREYDVLTLIAQGKSKLTIAGDLGVSKDTVDTYFRRIYAKLDVSDRAAAVSAAIAQGILVASDMRVSSAMLHRQPSAKAKKARS